VFDAAAALARARASAFRLEFKTSSQRERDDAETERRIRARAAELAARGPAELDRHAGAAYERARAQVMAEQADNLRRAQGEVAVLERQFEDAIRLTWAAVRRAGVAAKGAGT
jgi:hypothetical protein